MQLRSGLFASASLLTLTLPSAAQKLDVRQQLTPLDYFGSIEALRDVTGDGLADLLVLGWTDWQVQSMRVYAAVAGPRFEGPLSELPTTQAKLVGSAFLDVDGDGDLDVVTPWRPSCSSSSCTCPGSEVHLYLNDGAGVFTDATNQLPPQAARSFEFARAGDLDGDGDTDVVLIGALHQYSAPFVGTISCTGPSAILRNDGLGNFTYSTFSLAPFAPLNGDGECVDLAVADLDGDQAVEVIYAARNGEVLYLANDGTGGFSWTPSKLVGPAPVFGEWAQQLSLVDLDGNGLPELVVTKTRGDLTDLAPSVYLNDGTGTLVAQSVGLGGEVGSRHRLGDWDGDGDDDLLLAGFAEFPVLLNDGAAQFTRVGVLPEPPAMIPSNLPNRIVSADIDADGDEDLVYSKSTGGHFRVLLSDGTGAFSSVGLQFPAAASLPLAVTDLENDGDLDLVLSESLLLNDGSGRFVSASSGTVAGLSFVSEAIAQDFDGDGLSDLLTASTIVTPPSRVHFNTGGTFGAVATLPSSHNAGGAAVGDLEGDGDQDIVLRLFRSGSSLVTRYQNDGTGGFTLAPGVSPTTLNTTFTGDLAMGDFDGDGTPDVTDGCEVWFNAAGVFQASSGVTLSPAFYTVEQVALGDLDNDGDLDVMSAIRDSLPNPGGLFLNDGLGGFMNAGSQLSTLDPLNQTNRSLVLADFDDDGDLDSIWAAPYLASNFRSRYLENDGAANFQELSGALPVRWDFGGAFAGDFDQDGDVDLFAAGHDRHLLWNLATQVNWTTVPGIGKDLAFRLDGPSFGYWFLYSSRTRVQLTVPLLPGILWLDPGALTSQASGFFDVAGTATWSTRIPASVALVGQQVFAQAFVGAPNRLSNVETITITNL